MLHFTGLCRFQNAVGKERGEKGLKGNKRDECFVQSEGGEAKD